MFIPRRAALWAAASLLGGLPLSAQEGPNNTSDRAAVLHVLNRITFGPRPGDVEKVEQTGLHDFIEMQLHPESIDDSKCDSEIAKYELLQMSAPELGQLFYNELKERLKEAKKLQAEKAAMEGSTNAAPMESATPPAPSGMPPAPAMPNEDGAMQASPAMAANPAPPETATETPNEIRRKPGKIADALAKAAKAKTVEAIGEIEEAKLVRAVDSNRQLNEVLVDFWENHFNVDVKKGPDRILEIIEDRDVIRPHIWGRFRDLLEATAKSPAMLHYLDNATNTVERKLNPFQQQLRARFLQMAVGTDLANAVGLSTDPGKQPKKVGGINENYGREIMELHTIGVNAGYTQQDVQEVARCFTGWTFDRQTARFFSSWRRHAPLRSTTRMPRASASGTHSRDCSWGVARKRTSVPESERWSQSKGRTSGDGPLVASCGWRSVRRTLAVSPVRPKKVGGVFARRG